MLLEFDAFCPSMNCYILYRVKAIMTMLIVKLFGKDAIIRHYFSDDFDVKIVTDECTDEDLLFYMYLGKYREIKLAIHPTLYKLMFE